MPLLFVNGTLMRGLSLHGNLEGAVYLGQVRTGDEYRIHSIDDRHPGMYRDERKGARVAGELYDVSDAVLERVMDREPGGLYLDSVELEDGRIVLGILYPRSLATKYPEITRFGGWRDYREAMDKSA